MIYPIHSLMKASPEKELTRPDYEIAQIPTSDLMYINHINHQE